MNHDKTKLERRQKRWNKTQRIDKKEFSPGKNSLGMHAPSVVGSVSSASGSRSDLALYMASLPYLPSARLEEFRALATSASLLDQKRVERSRSEVLEALSKVGQRDSVARRLAAFSPGTQDRSFTSMQEILPGLFIGSYHPASNKQVLRSHNITHVCCCIGVPPPFPGDFQYHVFPAKDVPEEDILRFFRAAIAFIDAALSSPSGRVLVHCGAGISRASTISTAYLMHRLRLSFRDALHLVHSVRPFVRPNHGFLLQLKHFESLLSLQPLLSSPAFTNSLLTTSGPAVHAGSPGPALSASGGRLRATSTRPITAQLSVVMPELRPRPVPATLRAQSAAVAARRRTSDTPQSLSLARYVRGLQRS